MKRVQRDAEMRIGVLHDGNLVSHVDFDRQFLRNFTPQAGAQVRVTLFQLAAGKLPQPAQQPLVRALGQQQRRTIRLALPDDAGRHVVVGRALARRASPDGRPGCPCAAAAHRSCNGHNRQRGLCGVQIVAPSSMMPSLHAPASPGAAAATNARACCQSSLSTGGWSIGRSRSSSRASTRLTLPSSSGSGWL